MSKFSNHSFNTPLSHYSHYGLKYQNVAMFLNFPNGAKWSKDYTHIKRRMFDEKQTFAELFQNTITGPFRIAVDPIIKNKYLLCSLNQVGDSYRSPWSNTYFPFTSGVVDNHYLRSIEISTNIAFQGYYNEGITSTYAIDLGNSFAIVILFKKILTGVVNSSWETSHCFEVCEDNANCFANYKLSSKSILWVESNDASGTTGMHQAGYICLDVERDYIFYRNSSHIDVFKFMVHEQELRINAFLVEIQQRILNPLMKLLYPLPAKQVN